MAETVSMIAQISEGNNRATKYKVTMGTSSATADVPTGFKAAYFLVNPLNGASNNWSCRFNSMTAGTAIAGISLASCTSAGSYIVTVYGPNGAS